MGRQAVVDGVSKLAKEGVLPFLAPEATTTCGRSLIQFRTGAFCIEGVKVLPVCVKYTHSRVNPYWGIMGSTNVSLFRVMNCWWNAVEIKFLPLMDAPEGATPAEYAEAVRVEMAHAMDLPLCEVGLPEMKAILDAGCMISSWGRKRHGPMISNVLGVKSKGSIKSFHSDMSGTMVNPAVG
eukprot:CAMPEP_0172050380 /NCGR_PEP_ID=MMETSP1043-20130122/2576_1 /TAXON_ID=464988 /ORGANISM="Hemiselmis andersenii, Strain CCMP441" /LENGTH=180 /DNA_ID=CAMNT_0012709427 /DNA_START=10 /DNA_END=548 /DNA_ORIENTATION=-